MTDLTVTVEDAGGALSKPVGHAGWRERRGIWLTIRQDGAVVGRGEACPLPSGYGGSLEACRATLEALRTDIQQGGLASLDLGDPEGLRATSRRLLSKLEAPASGSAPFALETALVDLAGRSRGFSAARILRGAPPAYARVARSGLLGPDPDRWEAEIEAHRGRGISTLKVKLDRARFDVSVERLTAIRRSIGALRIDLNGCLGLAEAPARLARLARLEPELVEQPTGPADLLALGAVDVRWFADETLLHPELADAVLDASGCSGVILKPALVGLFEAERLAKAALARGLGVVVTHAFDGPIGLAAACALAMSLDAPPLASGLDRHPALLVFPECEIRALEIAGVVVDPAAPGLAIEGLG